MIDNQQNGSKSPNTLIVGAGPAGLTAGLFSVRQGDATVILESAALVGGISRTEVHKGFRYDIGGHRFYTKSKVVKELWREVMGNDFIRVNRMSRIFFGGQFYRYPLSITETLRNLGPVESVRIGISYLKAKVSPRGPEETFEDWVTARFGARLFRTFFKTYTEKVWGIPCSEIRADWAAQRIKGLSLRSAVMNAIKPSNNVKSLIEEFDYPRLGPGMMWEKFAAEIQNQKGLVIKDCAVTTVHHDGSRVTEIESTKEGLTEKWTPQNIISTIPLRHLVNRMDPPAPKNVLEAAAALRYRDFLMVGLVADKSDLFPDNWIYVHSPDVVVGRIQNFGNWSREMVPEKGVTSFGMEYFCNIGDEIWERSDEDLIALATRELKTLGLAGDAIISNGVVIRQPKAYPVYDEFYQNHINVIREWLNKLENLETVGRNGQHRYNNQDHSMLTGMYAATEPEKIDLWAVNSEREYHEIDQKPRLKPEASAR